MSRKLFIVDPENAALYHSLSRTLANEPDVEVVCDRRKRMLPWRRIEERRAPSDVQEQIRTRGFAVVHLARPGEQPGNIRWSA